MEKSDIEAMVRKLADEMEIKNLILKAAVYSDTIPDIDEFLAKYIEVFSEDCVWIFHPTEGLPDMGPFHGHEDIIAGARWRRENGITGAGTHCYHHILNTLVELDGDEARATSYMHFNSDGDATPQSHSFRVYKDQFRRTADGWKMTVRELCPG